jgi:hypothetical protein
LQDTTITLLVDIIKELVLVSDFEIEAFSSILKADIIEASKRGDVDFINKVIVPIL